MTQDAKQQSWNLVLEALDAISHIVLTAHQKFPNVRTCRAQNRWKRHIHEKTRTLSSSDYLFFVLFWFWFCFLSRSPSTGSNPQRLHFEDNENVWTTVWSHNASVPFQVQIFLALTAETMPGSTAQKEGLQIRWCSVFEHQLNPQYRFLHMAIHSITLTKAKDMIPNYKLWKHLLTELKIYRCNFQITWLICSES